MNKRAEHPGVLLGAIVICLLMSSICILIVPLAHNRDELTMICSCVFWLGIVFGYGLLIYVGIKRRKYSESGGHRHIGIITFFRNAPARLIDGLWIASVLLLIVSVLTGRIMQGYIQFVLAFLVVFLFHMHCFFNGENFRFLQIMIRRDDK